MEPARNAGKVKEVVYRRHRPEQTLPGVATQAHQRSKRKRICRYVARPAVSEKR